jgi:hypothetical protein
VADRHLVRIRIAAALVGVVADVVDVEGFHEAEGAVVERQAEDRHIVGVHHAVHEADRLPVRDHARGAARDFGQQRLVGIRGAAQFGIEARIT